MGNVCRVRRSQLGDRYFADDEEVETELQKWWRQQSKGLPCCRFRRTAKAIGQVYQRWQRICPEISFPPTPIRISNILRFMSICDLFSDSPSCYAEITLMLFLYPRARRVTGKSSDLNISCPVSS
jgi:hypothetical protein